MLEPPPAPVEAKPSATPATLQASPKRLISRLLTSFTAFLCAFLLLAYTLIFYCYPWKGLAAMEMPLWLIRYADRVPDYLRSVKHDDLLILGSSLILAPSSILNDVEMSAPDAEGHRSPAPKSTLYVRALTERTGHSPSLKILAVPGSVVTDQRLIFREIIAAGKKPKMIVFSLAPRDFIDNEIGDDETNTPTARVFTFLDHRKNFLPGQLSVPALEEWYKSQHTYFDLVRKHFSRTVLDWTCQVSGHPQSLYGSVLLKMPSTRQNEASNVSQADPAQVLQKDLAFYKHRYLPPNPSRYQKQIKALEDLLADAKQAGVKVLLVQMPITALNWNLLTETQKETLESDISRIAAAADVEFVNMNADAAKSFYKDSDFADSVHLGKSGAQIFVGDFTSRLSDSRAYKQAFH